MLDNTRYVNQPRKPGAGGPDQDDLAAMLVRRHAGVRVHCVRERVRAVDDRT
jgi:hypothetical protein